MLPALSLILPAGWNRQWLCCRESLRKGKNSLSSESIPANTPTCCKEKLCQRIWKRNWKSQEKTKLIKDKKGVKQKKRRCLYGKRKHLWGLGQWRDINMHHILVRYTCLGPWELLHSFCNEKLICHTKFFQSQTEQIGLLWILSIIFVCWDFSFCVMKTFEKR